MRFGTNAGTKAARYQLWWKGHPRSAGSSDCRDFVPGTYKNSGSKRCMDVTCTGELLPCRGPFRATPAQLKPHRAQCNLSSIHEVRELYCRPVSPNPSRLPLSLLSGGSKCTETKQGE